MALQHDDLKQMGIASVGHRLTILKNVYDVKRAHDVPIESDHYVPLCRSRPSLGARGAASKGLAGLLTAQ